MAVEHTSLILPLLAQPGGIETVSRLLASAFVEEGHAVKLITETRENDSNQWSFEVCRHPKPQELLRLTRWCDVFFHNNITLQSAWSLLLVQRPWVIAHHTWISRVDGTLGWRDHAKRFLLRFATNLSVSRAVARHLPSPSTLVGNPYQDDIFRSLPGIARTKDLIFVGRLVSDKGIGILIEALGELRKEQLQPSLTIVGTGPEEAALRALAIAHGVAEQVDFLGARTGVDLAVLLNRHEIIVVPSRWAEPFGMVALEGIACGCVVIGSENGGLAEAIGPCGLTFPNGSIEGLVAALTKVLADAKLREDFRTHRHAHLSPFKVRKIARQYLEIFENVTA